MFWQRVLRPGPGFEDGMLQVTCALCNCLLVDLVHHVDAFCITCTIWPLWMCTTGPMTSSFVCISVSIGWASATGVGVGPWFSSLLFEDSFSLLCAMYEFCLYVGRWQRQIPSSCNSCAMRNTCIRSMNVFSRCLHYLVDCAGRNLRMICCLDSCSLRLYLPSHGMSSHLLTNCRP